MLVGLSARGKSLARLYKTLAISRARDMGAAFVRLQCNECRSGGRDSFRSLRRGSDVGAASFLGMLQSMAC